jgi:hypothetical protein
MTTTLKYTASTLSKVEDILKKNEYTIRYEKGNFNSGYCVLENKKVVVVNKFYDTEARINCLVELINSIAINTEVLESAEKNLYALLQQKTLSL